MRTAAKTWMVKTELRNTNALQVYFKAGTVVKRMESNPYFPPANEYVAKVALWKDVLLDILKQQDTTVKLAERDEAQRKLKAALRTLASNIQVISNGDKAKILSTGFGTRRKKTKAAVLPAPLIKYSEKITGNGCIKLKWHADISAKMYKVYLSEADKPEERKHIGISTKSSLIVEGLESGKKYLLQVSALNTAGESGLSNAILVCEAWA